LLPEGYDIAEDSDFEYILDEDAPNAYENGVNGYYHYIGNSEFVIIPAKIRGNEIRDYYRMFDGTYVKGVYSDNPNITSMAFMFAGNYATSLDLRYLDTSSVTDMTGMFASSQTTKLDLSSFDTSNVTKTDNMFSGCKATTGYARTQADANKFNSSSNKPSALTFVVKN
jgi:surface protein